jgi:hypothetical protein
MSYIICICSSILCTSSDVDILLCIRYIFEYYVAMYFRPRAGAGTKAHILIHTHVPGPRFVQYKPLGSTGRYIYRSSKTCSSSYYGILSHGDRPFVAIVFFFYVPPRRRCRSRISNTRIQKFCTIEIPYFIALSDTYISSSLDLSSLALPVLASFFHSCILISLH